jgi:hypothetical protein
MWASGVLIILVERVYHSPALKESTCPIGLKDLDSYSLYAYIPICLYSYMPICLYAYLLAMKDSGHVEIFTRTRRRVARWFYVLRRAKHLSPNSKVQPHCTVYSPY